MKNNSYERFFTKIFNIKDNRMPVIALLFIATIIFEFVIALPIYNFISKEIGFILLVGVFASFLAICIYSLFKMLLYIVKSNKDEG
ncbi:hypothetical protein [Helicovermis profundi]|uniref:Uncharacterized protein n=1 Tax=Helicovermis profundi TaxID=3065157 RepID=A0AAU9ERN2_9FIRM|nr:hypothetical protein HLPR_23670 [Clostridia bacterium S502]